MRIALIDKEKHKLLLDIQKNNPLLTYQNKDYDEFDKSKMTEDDKISFDKVTDILKEHIVGFKRFQNFKIRKNGDICIRFQYDYEADLEPHVRKVGFTGVGYIKVDELLNGFDNYESKKEQN